MSVREWDAQPDSSAKVTCAPAPKAFYTLKELCERWSVCRMTVYREIRRGRLRKKRIGGTLRFSAEEVYRYERQAGG